MGEKIDLGQCMHCKLLFSSNRVAIHEAYCDKNPHPTVVAFSSLGKRFYKKPESLPPMVAPKPRVCAIVYANGWTYPILQDDLFAILARHPLRIDRLGKLYDTQHFKIRPTTALADDDVDFLDEVWAAIEKARKAGARLR